MSRPTYTEALRATRALELLSAFDPHVAGTPPLGIDLPDSDIDILCHAPDLDRFAAIVRENFGKEQEFSIRRWDQRQNGGEDAVIANFRAHDWEFEIFAQTVPVEEQAGWCHFQVEQRLLHLGGESFRAAIMEQRDAGLKTEPAFAKVLHFGGDPYEAMLAFSDADDETLWCLLRGLGHAKKESFEPLA